MVLYILEEKNKKLKLPEKGDSLYFDGYPRSGNTYTFGLIYRVFPSLHCNVSHHLHAKIPLKMALNKNVKSIIIIRKPDDAIVSYLFSKKEHYFKDNTVLNSLVLQYKEYYDYVLKNINNLRIINFDEFVKGEQEVLKGIEKYTGRSSQVNLGEHVDGYIDFKYFLRDYKNRMGNFQKIQS